MLFLANEWKKSDLISRHTVQFVVLLITLLLFALAAGAPIDYIGGGSTSIMP